MRDERQAQLRKAYATKVALTNAPPYYILKMITRKSHMFCNLQERAQKRARRGGAARVMTT